MSLTLILGGARSGKSRRALALAESGYDRVLFVATAQASDEEMARRIAAHRAERPSHWQTLEAPLNVGHAIVQRRGTFDLVILDCLTLLASNVLLSLGDEVAAETAEFALQSEIDALLSAHRDSTADWIIVSNEVGFGLVPPTRLGRIYRDALGRANQQLAAAADQVVLMVAGLPVTIKPSSPSL